MKIIATSFAVRPGPAGRVELEIIDAEIQRGEPCLALSDAAKRLGISRGTLAAEIQRRPELARRVCEGKIVLPESSLAALLQPYAPKARVVITERQTSGNVVRRSSTAGSAHSKPKAEASALD